jgi:hypothetical protein
MFSKTPQNSNHPIPISIWGEYPGKSNFGNDYLWHDVVSTLPEIGSTLELFNQMYQVEAVYRDQMLLDETEISQPRYVVEVRLYDGDISPSLLFNEEDT